MNFEAHQLQCILLAFIVGWLVGATIYQTIKDILK